jgi:BirA family biotin operon repressor/biotin-[acetyl-CoA-carboxylase] ligase
LLPANSIGIPFIELHSVESTNNYAMALIHAGLAQHGTAVFAHEQTKGKGQRNKQWLSTKNENIILSIIITPYGLPATQIFLLSMVTAIAVQNFFRRYAGEGTKIKWPNDIYWNDRKAGGILIENVIQGQNWKFAITGIGLNLNQMVFNNINTKAVSLKQITGVTYETISMAKELMAELDTSLLHLTTGTPEELTTEYTSRLYKLNETVQLKKGGNIFNALIKGVTTDGCLIVQHDIEETFRVGGVEWIM